MKTWRTKLIATLLLGTCSLGLTICSIGCNSTSLYPLEGSHIIDVNKGEALTAPRDGYFLSNEYFEKVLRVKVKDF